MIQRCRLCGLDGDIQKSHIMPKFIAKRLKDRTATGFFVNAMRPSKRVQDFPKYDLLCRNCEERFSKFETYFANNVYDQFNKEQPHGEYDNRLEKFVVSLSWRVLTVDQKKVELNHPIFTPLVNRAETCWREFLLGTRQNVRPYENHILFLRKLSGPDIPLGFNEYAQLAASYGMASTDARVFVYASFPGMCFVSTIAPTTLDGWHGTRVNESGFFSNSQRVLDVGFWEYFLNNARLAAESLSNTSSKLTQKRLQKAIKTNPTKFFRSETIQIRIERRFASILKKMDGMPELVIELACALKLSFASSLSTGKIQENGLNFEKILDTLSNLSLNESVDLGNMIQSVVTQNVTFQSDTKSTFQTNSIWITFMAHNNPSKKYRRSIIKQELEYLKKLDIRTPILVASITPNGSDEFGILA